MQAPDIRTRRSRLAVWVFLLYAVSFFLPFGWVEDHCVYGWDAFLMGMQILWMSPLSPWLANLVMWIGIVCLAAKENRNAGLFGVFALLLGLTCLTWKPADPNVFISLFSRAPEIAELGPAYWTWLGSMALLVFAGFRSARTERRAGDRPLTLFPVEDSQREWQLPPIQPGSDQTAQEQEAIREQNAAVKS